MKNIEGWSIFPDFCRFWSIFPDFGRFWSIFPDFSWFWSILVDFGRFLTLFDHFSGSFFIFALGRAQPANRNSPARSEDLILIRKIKNYKGKDQKIGNLRGFVRKLFFTRPRSRISIFLIFFKNLEKKAKSPFSSSPPSSPSGKWAKKNWDLLPKSRFFKVRFCGAAGQQNRLDPYCIFVHLRPNSGLKNYKI